MSVTINMEPVNTMAKRLPRSHQTQSGPDQPIPIVPGKSSNTGHSHRQEISAMTYIGNLQVTKVHDCHGSRIDREHIWQGPRTAIESLRMNKSSSRSSAMCANHRGNSAFNSLFCVAIASISLLCAPGAWAQTCSVSGNEALNEAIIDGDPANKLSPEVADAMREVAGRVVDVDLSHALEPSIRQSGEVEVSPEHMAELYKAGVLENVENEVQPISAVDSGSRALDIAVTAFSAYGAFLSVVVVASTIYTFVDEIEQGKVGEAFLNLGLAVGLMVVFPAVMSLLEVPVLGELAMVGMLFLAGYAFVQELNSLNDVKATIPRIKADIERQSSELTEKLSDFKVQLTSGAKVLKKWDNEHLNEVAYYATKPVVEKMFSVPMTTAMNAKRESLLGIAFPEPDDVNRCLNARYEITANVRARIVQVLEAQAAGTGGFNADGSGTFGSVGNCSLNDFLCADQYIPSTDEAQTVASGDSSDDQSDAEADRSSDSSTPLLVDGVPLDPNSGFGLTSDVPVSLLVWGMPLVADPDVDLSDGVNVIVNGGAIWTVPEYAIDASRAMLVEASNDAASTWMCGNATSFLVDDLGLADTFFPMTPLGPSPDLKSLDGVQQLLRLASASDQNDEQQAGDLQLNPQRDGLQNEATPPDTSNWLEARLNRLGDIDHGISFRGPLFDKTAFSKDEMERDISVIIATLDAEANTRASSYAAQGWGISPVFDDSPHSGPVSLSSIDLEHNKWLAQFVHDYYPTFADTMVNEIDLKKVIADYYQRQLTDPQLRHKLQASYDKMVTDQLGWLYVADYFAEDYTRLFPDAVALEAGLYIVNILTLFTGDALYKKATEALFSELNQVQVVLKILEGFKSRGISIYDNLGLRSVIKELSSRGYTHLVQRDFVTNLCNGIYDARSRANSLLLGGTNRKSDPPELYEDDDRDDDGNLFHYTCDNTHTPEGEMTDLPAQTVTDEQIEEFKASLESKEDQIRAALTVRFRNDSRDSSWLGVRRTADGEYQAAHEQALRAAVLSAGYRGSIQMLSGVLEGMIGTETGYSVLTINNTINELVDMYSKELVLMPAPGSSELHGSFKYYTYGRTIGVEQIFAATIDYLQRQAASALAGNWLPEMTPAERRAIQTRAAADAAAQSEFDQFVQDADGLFAVQSQDESASTSIDTQGDDLSASDATHVSFVRDSSAPFALVNPNAEYAAQLAMCAGVKKDDQDRGFVYAKIPYYVDDAMRGGRPYDPNLKYGFRIYYDDGLWGEDEDTNDPGDGPATDWGNHPSEGLRSVRYGMYDNAGDGSLTTRAKAPAGMFRYRNKTYVPRGVYSGDIDPLQKFRDNLPVAALWDIGTDTSGGRFDNFFDHDSEFTIESYIGYPEGDQWFMGGFISNATKSPMVDYLALEAVQALDSSRNWKQFYGLGWICLYRDPHVREELLDCFKYRGEPDQTFNLEYSGYDIMQEEPTKLNPWSLPANYWSDSTDRKQYFSLRPYRESSNLHPYFKMICTSNNRGAYQTWITAGGGPSWGGSRALLSAARHRAATEGSYRRQYGDIPGGGWDGYFAFKNYYLADNFLGYCDFARKFSDDMGMLQRDHFTQYDNEQVSIPPVGSLARAGYESGRMSLLGAGAASSAYTGSLPSLGGFLSLNTFNSRARVSGPLLQQSILANGVRSMGMMVRDGSTDDNVKWAVYSSRIGYRPTASVHMEATVGVPYQYTGTEFNATGINLTIQMDRAAVAWVNTTNGDGYPFLSRAGLPADSSSETQSPLKLRVYLRTDQSNATANPAFAAMLPLSVNTTANSYVDIPIYQSDFTSSDLSILPHVLSNANVQYELSVSKQFLFADILKNHDFFKHGGQNILRELNGFLDIAIEGVELLHGDRRMYQLDIVDQTVRTDTPISGNGHMPISLYRMMYNPSFWKFNNDIRPDGATGANLVEYLRNRSRAGELDEADMRFLIGPKADNGLTVNAPSGPVGIHIPYVRLASGYTGAANKYYVVLVAPSAHGADAFEYPEDVRAVPVAAGPVEGQPPFLPGTVLSTSTLPMTFHQLVLESEWAPVWRWPNISSRDCDSGHAHLITGAFSGGNANADFEERTLESLNERRSEQFQTAIDQFTQANQAIADAQTTVNAAYSDLWYLFVEAANYRHHIKVMEAQDCLASNDDAEAADLHPSCNASVTLELQQFVDSQQIEFDLAAIGASASTLTRDELLTQMKERYHALLADSAGIVESRHLSIGQTIANLEGLVGQAITAKIAGVPLSQGVFAGAEQTTAFNAQIDRLATEENEVIVLIRRLRALQAFVQAFIAADRVELSSFMIGIGESVEAMADTLSAEIDSYIDQLAESDSSDHNAMRSRIALLAKFSLLGASGEIDKINIDYFKAANKADEIWKLSDSENSRIILGNSDWLRFISDQSHLYTLAKSSVFKSWVEFLIDNLEDQIADNLDIIEANDDPDSEMQVVNRRRATSKINSLTTDVNYYLENWLNSQQASVSRTVTIESGETLSYRTYEQLPGYYIYDTADDDFKRAFATQMLHAAVATYDQLTAAREIAVLETDIQTAIDAYAQAYLELSTGSSDDGEAEGGDASRVNVRQELEAEFLAIQVAVDTWKDQSFQKLRADTALKEVVFELKKGVWVQSRSTYVSGINDFFSGLVPSLADMFDSTMATEDGRQEVKENYEQGQYGNQYILEQIGDMHLVVQSAQTQLANGQKLKKKLDMLTDSLTVAQFNDLAEAVLAELLEGTTAATALASKGVLARNHVGQAEVQSQSVLVDLATDLEWACRFYKCSSPSAVLLFDLDMSTYSPPMLTKTLDSADPVIDSLRHSLIHGQRSVDVFRQQVVILDQLAEYLPSDDGIVALPVSVEGPSDLSRAFKHSEDLNKVLDRRWYEFNVMVEQYDDLVQMRQRALEAARSADAGDSIADNLLMRVERYQAQMGLIAPGPIGDGEQLASYLERVNQASLAWQVARFDIHRNWHTFQDYAVMLTEKSLFEKHMDLGLPYFTFRFTHPSPQFPDGRPQAVVPTAAQLRSNIDATLESLRISMKARIDALNGILDNAPATVDAMVKSDDVYVWQFSVPERYTAADETDLEDQSSFYVNLWKLIEQHTKDTAKLLDIYAGNIVHFDLDGANLIDGTRYSEALLASPDAANSGSNTLWAAWTAGQILGLFYDSVVAGEKLEEMHGLISLARSVSSDIFPYIESVKYRENDVQALKILEMWKPIGDKVTGVLQNSGIMESAIETIEETFGDYMPSEEYYVELMQNGDWVYQVGGISHSMETLNAITDLTTELTGLINIFDGRERYINLISDYVNSAISIDVQATRDTILHSMVDFDFASTRYESDRLQTTMGEWAAARTAAEAILPTWTEARASSELAQQVAQRAAALYDTVDETLQARARQHARYVSGLVSEAQSDLAEVGQSIADAQALHPVAQSVASGDLQQWIDGIVAAERILTSVVAQASALSGDGPVYDRFAAAQQALEQADANIDETLQAIAELRDAAAQQVWNTALPLITAANAAREAVAAAQDRLTNADSTVSSLQTQLATTGADDPELAAGIQTLLDEALLEAASARAAFTEASEAATSAIEAAPSWTSYEDVPDERIDEVIDAAALTALQTQLESERSEREAREQTHTQALAAWTEVLTSTSTRNAVRRVREAMTRISSGVFETTDTDSAADDTAGAEEYDPALAIDKANLVSRWASTYVFMQDVYLRFISRYPLADMFGTASAYQSDEVAGRYNEIVQELARAAGHLVDAYDDFHDYTHDSDPEWASNWLNDIAMPNARTSSSSLSFYQPAGDRMQMPRQVARHDYSSLQVYLDSGYYSPVDSVSAEGSPQDDILVARAALEANIASYSENRRLYAVFYRVNVNDSCGRDPAEFQGNVLTEYNYKLLQLKTSATNLLGSYFSLARRVLNTADDVLAAGNAMGYENLGIAKDITYDDMDRLHVKIAEGEYWDSSVPVVAAPCSPAPGSGTASGPVSEGVASYVSFADSGDETEEIAVEDDFVRPSNLNHALADARLVARILTFLNKLNEFVGFAYAYGADGGLTTYTGDDLAGHTQRYHNLVAELAVAADAFVRHNSAISATRPDDVTSMHEIYGVTQAVMSAATHAINSQLPDASIPEEAQQIYSLIVTEQDSAFRTSIDVYIHDELALLTFIQANGNGNNNGEYQGAVLTRYQQLRTRYLAAVSRYVTDFNAVNSFRPGDARAIIAGAGIRQQYHAAILQFNLNRGHDYSWSPTYTSLQRQSPVGDAPSKTKR